MPCESDLIFEHTWISFIAARKPTCDACGLIESHTAQKQPYSKTVPNKASIQSRVRDFHLESEQTIYPEKEQAIGLSIIRRRYNTHPREFQVEKYRIDRIALIPRE